MILKSIILAFFCSFLSFILHLVISFFRKGRLKNEPVIFELTRQMKLLLAIWLAFCLFYTILFFWQPLKINALINRLNASIPTIGFIYGLFFYLILAFLYLSLYYFVNRSVSATILELIENSPDKKLTETQIKDRYNIENKYQSELRGMLEGKFIIKNQGYYQNTLKGESFALIAKAVKRYLKLGLGG